MGRLRMISRTEVTDPFVASMYERIFGDADPDSGGRTLDGTPGDWWTTFALVPSVLRHAVRGFALYQSPNRVLRRELRELGQTRAGWVLESRFVFSQHVKACRAAGIAEEKIAAIPAWEVSLAFDEAERAVLAYTDALTAGAGRVPDGVFEALSAHLTDEAILELTYITAMYAMHAMMSRALRVEWDGVADPITEVADEGPVGY